MFENIVNRNDAKLQLVLHFCNVVFRVNWEACFFSY